jgi:hypothetical protein
VVIVGADDRMVRVSFGTIQFVLSAHDGGATVLVRAEGYDINGHAVALESRGATDIRNTVEYRLREDHA